MCGHRQDRRDVLIWPDDQDTTIFTIDATQIMHRQALLLKDCVGVDC